VTVSPALGEAQQVVGLLAVRLGLEVLVAVTADGDDHVHDVTAPADVELPLASLDPLDGLRLGDLLGRAVVVPPADVQDSLVRVGPVTLVDAEDFVAGGHIITPGRNLMVVCGGILPNAGRMPHLYNTKSRVPQVWASGFGEILGDDDRKIFVRNSL